MLSWLPRDPLPVGSKAPDFTLPTQAGKKVKLSSLRGKNVVLVFYPGDDTMICRKQLCEFRDAWPDFRGLNVVVFGINPQSAESHREFRDRYQFPFPLLVDADQQVAALYNSDGGMVNRTVYLIGPDGVIRYARRGMPQPQEVLALLRKTRAAEELWRYSVERLSTCRTRTNEFDFDFIVIGSGFGGSVTRASSGGEGLSRRRHGDGPPLDAREPAQNQLGDASLVLAAGHCAARLLQHALLPARHHPARLRSGRRIDYVRLHHAAASRQGVGQRLVEGPRRLEVGDAPALRHGIADARRHREQDSRASRSLAEEGGRLSRSGRYLLSHQRRHLPGAGGSAGRSDRCPTRTSAAKVRSEPRARVAAAA